MAVQGQDSNENDNSKNGWPLRMWVVYDHPRDFPDYFIAREWLVDGSGERATASTIQSKRLETIRETLCAQMGKVCIGRSSRDEPKIIEVWL
jgi:hypothetical protein